MRSCLRASHKKSRVSLGDCRASGRAGGRVINDAWLISGNSRLPARTGQALPFG